jgi:hypothetical protein
MHTKFGVPGEAPDFDSSDEDHDESSEILPAETDQQRTNRIFSLTTPTIDDLTEVLSRWFG